MRETGLPPPSEDWLNLPSLADNFTTGPDGQVRFK